MFVARIVEEVIQCDGDGCDRWLKIECPSRCSNPKNQANDAIRKKGWHVLGYGDKHLCRDCMKILRETNSLEDREGELVQESNLSDSPHDDMIVMEVKGGSVQRVAVSSEQGMKFLCVDRDIDAYDDEDLINVEGKDSFIYEISPVGREDTDIINEIVSLDIV